MKTRTAPTALPTMVAEDTEWCDSDDGGEPGWSSGLVPIDSGDVDMDTLEELFTVPPFVVVTILVPADDIGLVLIVALPVLPDEPVLVLTSAVAGRADDGLLPRSLVIVAMVMSVDCVGVELSTALVELSIALVLEVVELALEEERKNEESTHERSGASSIAC
jgi:hypothetical protein